MTRERPDGGAAEANQQPATAAATVPRDSDIRDYLAAVADGMSGVLHVATGARGRWDDGKYRFDGWTETRFAYPAEAGLAAREMLRAAEDSDVYVCPYVTRGDKRSKGAAVAHVLVHADVDSGDLDAERVRAIPGAFAVSTGTPGHGHVYVRLTREVGADDHRALCIGLRDHLGADSKISDNDLLRAPGTRNHKAAAMGSETAEVDWLVRPGNRVDPAPLAEFLGVILGRPVAASATNGAAVAEPVDLSRCAGVRAAVDCNTGDRSADTMRIVHACCEGGLTLAQTRWVIASRADLAQRLADRTDDDVHNCWLKAVDARQIRRRQGTVWLGDAGTAGPGPDPVPGPMFARNGHPVGSDSGPVPQNGAPDLQQRSDPNLDSIGSGPAVRLYVDIKKLLAEGLPEPPKPDVLARTDGHCLFYRRQVNWLFSDPETGKTFVALAAVAVELIKGGKALFIDLDHNGPDAIVDRLLMMGAPLSVLTDQARFRYCEPDDSLTVAQVVGDSAQWKPDVVVVDSVGELIPLFGRDSNSADDFTRVHTAVLKPLAVSGAAVVAIDHLAKGADSRAQGPAGTAAKRRTIGGVSLRVKVMRPFTIDQGGAAILLVHKDRHGGVRRHCPVGEREPMAGTFVLKPANEIADGELCWHINAPKPGDRDPDAGAEPDLVNRIAVMDPPPSSIDDARERLGVRKDRAAKAYREWKAQQQESNGAA
ncbi:hypothetical protein ACGFK1_11720 [Mycobacterium sp. NPDC048908]|uniref:hypothetical protein n=1 Tax=Mycobacterium sp. NPDC048908 TaxID=3364292 RepID=UPI0037249F0A